MIAGNHDFSFEKQIIKDSFDYGRVIYLEDSGTEIEGLKIYGSPVQPWFCDWAFNVHRGAAIKKYWDKIPEGLDILITHGPPNIILDQSILGRSDHLGCEDLLANLAITKPKIHVFGHIHGSYGRWDSANTKYINASVVNEAYQVVNEPQVIEL
jgi:Icc-related predicted phosphoesterase